MTESEKLVADTLRLAERDGRIQWGHKFEAQIRGKFRTPAPIDFLIVHEDIYYPVEVKEQGAISIPFGHFKPEQKRLLNALPNALMVLRYFSSDYTRNNLHYFEHYFLARGSRWCPEPEEKGGGVKFSSLLESDSAVHLASHQNGIKTGFDEGAGLTSRDNPSMGLPRLIEALESEEIQTRLF